MVCSNEGIRALKFYIGQNSVFMLGKNSTKVLNQNDRIIHRKHGYLNKIQSKHGE